MDIKTFGRIELKAGDKGEFSAVIATFDVIDKDGDVTLPGAFTDQAELVVSAYGHQSWGGALPVGKGRIRTTAAEAIVDGQFFMDTAAGKDTFLAVKQLGSLQEWSYGYKAIDAEPGEKDGQRVRFLKRLEVREASPVLEGAGINTRTLATKAAIDAGLDPEATVRAVKGEAVDAVQYKAAIRPHNTPTTAREWDGTAVTAAIPDAASVTALRSMHAWVDAAGDPEAKTNYRFPHHHGIDGPANIRALVAGIAVLNGARGGTTIPDGDRKAVYEHLASHLRDAGREPPPLKAADGGTTFHEEAIDTLAGVSDLLGSAQRVVALRASKGKNLSHINVEVLEWINDDLCRLQKQFRSLLDTPREQAAVEYVRYLASQHRAAG
ncbi:MAG: HK97 family phage prohead protease [Thermoanaerobaculia bacterium]